MGVIQMMQIHRIMRITILVLSLLMAIGGIFNLANAQVVITMEKKGNVFYLPGRINGLELQFVFDTGASHVYLSMTEAMFMVKNQYLSPDDFTGKVSQSLVANGTIEENMEVILKEVELGGIVLNNIKAFVSRQFDAPLLLGQSVIQELGPIQLDGNKLIITTKNSQSDEALIKTLTDQALSLAEYGDLDESLEVSMRVVRMTNDPVALSMIYDNIGFIHYSKNDLQKAADAYKRATELNPSNVMSNYNFGVMLYELGQYEKAATVFKNLIYNNSRSRLVADAYAYLGDSQMELGEFSNARDSYLASLRARPTSQADFGLADYYRSTNQPAQATKYLEEGIAYEPSRPSNVRRLFQLGSCYFESDNIEKAKNAFHRCESLVAKLWGDKDLSGVDAEIQEMFAEHMFYGTRSSVLLARIEENPIEKIRQYTKVWGMHKSGVFDIIDYLQYSSLLKAVGDDDRAKNVVMDALEDKPQNPDLLFLASLLSNNPSETISYLSAILPQEYEYNPIAFDYEAVYNNIAWAHHRAGNSEKGLPFAEKAIKKNPARANSWETLGEIYFSLERYSDCVDAMTECIAREGGDQMKNAYLYRGKSLIKLGKKREGQKDVKIAEGMKD